MKVNKNFIRSITSICVVVLCFSLFVFSVSAESTGAEFFDFDQYATYEELPDTDEVKATITLPDSWYISYLSGMNLPPVYGHYTEFEVQGMFGPFSVHTSPFGSLWNYYDIVDSNTHILDLSLMPKDFVLYGGFTFEYYGEFNYQTDFSEVYVLCFNEYGEQIDVWLADDYLSIYDNSNGYVRGEYEFVFDSSNLQYVIGDIKGITFQFDLGLFLNAGSNSSVFTIDMNPFEMDFLTTNAFINNRNDRIIRDKLSNLEKQLGDINNKLDELPDKIGDEFENVIEQEKEQAKQEGNKFVDQVLDKLPDPSQGVLAALGELTAAVGYTGTEAVIPFPAIVIPGIEGLFDEIVIYDGSDFDLGACIEYIPEVLLTVIRSLFTIAIVLYCVYELKGIISFIFTLKEKNNG